MRSEGYSTWSVCVCVSTQHLTFHVIIRATNELLTFSAADERRKF